VLITTVQITIITIIMLINNNVKCNFYMAYDDRITIKIASSIITQFS